MIQKTLSLLTSVAIVALSSSSAEAFSLIGSELGFRAETQRTPTSPLLVNRSPISTIVSESAVEFPDVRSLFDPRDFPGFSMVNATVDVGADYLEFDYAKAGFGTFSNTFKNDYVFTFTAPIALQITEVSIDPRTTLRLTPEKVTFAGNELFVNVSGLFFSPNSFARINLTTAAVADPDTDIVPVPKDPADVPEPSALLGIALVVGGLAYSKRRRFA